MRYADCRGSYRCTNVKCPFRVQYGVINTTQIEKDATSSEVCRVCQEKAEYVPCPGRRYVKLGKSLVKVFHCGTHTCPVVNKPSKPTERVRDILKKTPELKPSQVQSAFILSALRSEEDWDKVQSEASQILDRKWIANQKQNLKREINPYRRKL